MTRSLRAWLHRASRRPRAPRTATAIFAVSVVLGACGSSIPVVSFDPSSACTTDGRQPGAYPELEALLPVTFEGKAPDNVDSGRNCTPTALGALADAGIDAVHFAGATWALGGSSAVTLAVFDGAGLDPTSMVSFYEQSARTDRHTEKLATRDEMVGGLTGRRLDVLASNGAGHTVVAWPAGREDTVFVLLASDLGDAAVAKALDELAAP